MLGSHKEYPKVSLISDISTFVFLNEKRYIQAVTSNIEKTHTPHYVYYN
jgi:hypothetical protein